jgi:hypothetical protein
MTLYLILSYMLQYGYKNQGVGPIASILYDVSYFFTK